MGSVHVHASLATIIGSLCLLRAVADAFAVARLRPDRSQHWLDMFRFVLANDDRWRPVLAQMVRVTERTRPPYQDDRDARAVLRLPAAAVTADGRHLWPLAVLRAVVDEFAWLGSYVDYAAIVLREAVTCFTYTNVALIMELTMAMDDQWRHAVAANPEYRAAPHRDVLWDAVAAFAVFADKLAAVLGDLQPLVDGLSAYARGARTTDADVSRSSLGPARDEVRELIRSRCHNDPDAAGRAAVYSKVRVDVAPWLASEPVEAVTLQMVKSLFDRVVERLLRVYEGLHVRSFPPDLWTQISDHPDDVDVGPAKQQYS